MFKALSTLALGALAALALGSAATAAAKTAAPACDEGCLLDVATAYMDSMTTNDPAGAPFAAKVRSTENMVAAPPTAGIWKTATSWRYRHTVVDPVQGQIGILGTVREGGDGDDHEAFVSIRLKVEGHKITENEVMISRKGDFSLFVPEWTAEVKPIFSRIEPADTRSTRAFLAQIPHQYFHAIAAGNPGLVPVHPDANRYENGYQTTNSPARPSSSVTDGLRRLVYMQGFHQMRTPVIDTRRGLVLALLASDMPVMDKTIQVRGKPLVIDSKSHHLPRTMFVYELFKIEDGKVVAIEAHLRNGPLGADMGWPGASK